MTFEMHTFIGGYRDSKLEQVLARHQNSADDLVHEFETVKLASVEQS